MSKIIKGLRDVIWIRFGLTYRAYKIRPINAKHTKW